MLDYINNHPKPIKIILACNIWYYSQSTDSAFLGFHPDKKSIDIKSIDFVVNNLIFDDDYPDIL